MGLALGIMFIWLGAACLWVASHGTDAKSPWDVYKQILKGLREGPEVKP